MKNNSPVKMLITLSVTALLIGGLLAGFYKFVYPYIEANRIAEEKIAIFTVLPEAKDYDIVEYEIPSKKKGTEIVQVFRGKDENGDLMGFAFVAAGPGFQGIIKMMVGLNLEKTYLEGMTVLDHMETPGLGDKITFDFFLDQFKKLNIKPRITYIKNVKPKHDNQIQTITGATISAVAIVKTLNKKIAIVLELLAGPPGKLKVVAEPAAVADQAAGAEPSEGKGK